MGIVERMQLKMGGKWVNENSRHVPIKDNIIAKTKLLKFKSIYLKPGKYSSSLLRCVSNGSIGCMPIHFLSIDCSS